MGNKILFLILILALVGVIDAGYLLVQTVSGEAVVCPSVPIGRFNLNQCNIVLATSYAKFFGLPTAFYGLVAYLIFTILVLCEKTRFVKLFSANKLLLYLSGLGVLISAYFIYLQFFIIKAICFYCLVSAAIIILIFALSAVYNLRYSKNLGV